MHRLFTVQELLQQILEHFLVDVHVDSWPLGISLPSCMPDRQSRLTLRNAALVCRLFKDTALDVLWWAMDDLTPLFSLLSGFRRQGHGIGVIDGRISEADLALFFGYAKRIRLYNFVDQYGIYTSSYIQVLDASHRECLLPCLKYFLCQVSSPEINFLVSPTLRCLAVLVEPLSEDDPPPVDMWALLNSLPQKATGLRRLHVAYSMSENCVVSITKLPQLQSLQVCNYQLSEGQGAISLDPFFQNLSTLSSTTTLYDLHLDGAFELPVTPMLHLHSQAMPAFALRSLRMTYDSIQITQATHLFSIAAFPRLEELDVLVDSVREFDQKETRQWQAFSRALVQATTSAFRSLSLRVKRRPVGHKIPLSAIPALLQLPLTYFYMQMLLPLTVEDINLMGQAWPQLNELVLDSTIPFDRLVQVALSFPALQFLDARLDRHSYPPIDDIPKLNHPLRKLDVTRGTTSPDPFTFASCVDRLFPNLERFPIPSIRRADEHGSWSQTKGFLVALQRARADQEERITGIPRKLKLV